MLAELKDKSQVTIPKPVVKELGLEKGDMFDVVVSDGRVMLIPVVVYPKEEIDRLKRLAAQSRAEETEGRAPIFDNTKDAIAYLHEEDE